MANEGILAALRGGMGKIDEAGQSAAEAMRYYGGPAAQGIMDAASTAKDLLVPDINAFPRDMGTMMDSQAPLGERALAGVDYLGNAADIFLPGTLVSGLTGTALKNAQDTKALRQTPDAPTGSSPQQLSMESVSTPDLSMIDEAMRISDEQLANLPRTAEEARRATGSDKQLKMLREKLDENLGGPSNEYLVDMDAMEKARSPEARLNYAVDATNSMALDMERSLQKFFDKNDIDLDSEGLSDYISIASQDTISEGLRDGSDITMPMYRGIKKGIEDFLGKEGYVIGRDGYDEETMFMAQDLFEHLAGRAKDYGVDIKAPFEAETSMRREARMSRGKAEATQRNAEIDAGYAQQEELVQALGISPDMPQSRKDAIYTRYINQNVNSDLVESINESNQQTRRFNVIDGGKE